MEAATLELASKIAAVAVSLAGVFITLSKLWTDNQHRGRQGKKIELDLLTDALEEASDDQAYRSFLKDIRKEKLMLLLFGCSVPNAELGKLMAYYRRGTATISEIRLAWDYRVTEDETLRFRLSKLDRWWLFANWAYGFTFGSGAALCLCLGIYSLIWSAKWQFALQFGAYGAALLLAVILFWRINAGVWAARALERRERTSPAMNDDHSSSLAGKSQ